jgi:glutamate---cysteine ligase / carboxylate-amine ligase
LATMEINSSIHVDADGMSTEVQALTQLLRGHAQSLGLDVRGGGTQLTQFWNDRVFAPTARSKELEGRFGFLPKRFSTYGMHVHIGVPDGDAALRLGAVLQALVPTFIALSAASPFLQLQDTGFCASRPLEPLVYPHGGPMPRVGSWAEFEVLVEELFSTKLAFSLKDIYWDVRPKPEFGTVEVRVFDTPLSVHKAVALAAFTRGCAALALNGSLRLTDSYPREGVERVNRFLACRDGLAARLCDPFTQQWVTARELAQRLFSLVAAQPVCEQDARHIAALRAHCERHQDSDRMREAQARWQLIGAEPDRLASGLPAYSSLMCGLLFEPLA